MNIEEKAIEVLKYCKDRNFSAFDKIYFDDGTNMCIFQAIETLLTAYEKEKEKNKELEELYIQHNQMIINILKECDYMIKNRYYMNDVAIGQYAQKIKDIAKYYIKEPEWTELKEE